MDASLLKQPCAWIPPVMSLAALALVIGHVAVYGVTQGADEGTAARVFQLLLAAQLPVVGYFALRWLPKRPAATLVVLTLQAIAGLVPIVLVWWLERNPVPA